MKRFVLRLIMVMAGMLIGHSAFAAPVVCSWGYQDSTCLVPLRGSGPPAPTCSGAGVTTVTPAVWLGSHWSQPTCQTQAPPTCQAGYTQTSAPVWNGSSWSAPGCALPYSPPPPPPISPNAVVAVAQVNANIWCPYWNTSPDNWAAASEWGIWDTESILQFTFGDGSQTYWLGGLSAEGGMTLQQFYNYITNGGYQYTYYNIVTPGVGVDVKVSPLGGCYLAMMS